MSLILEALRKSEAERRRGQAPDVSVELSPLPAPARAGTPAWVWPTIIVAAVLAALAAWWTTRDPAAPSAATDSLDAAQLATPESRIAAPAPAAPVIVPRGPAPSAPPATEPARPATSTVAPAPAPPMVVDAPGTQDVPSPPPQRTTAPVPSADGIPGVRLSMHMWNDAPARRFVILNGQRMVEGDRNGELTLVEIQRDGVVVEHDGQRARIGLP